MSTQMEIFLLQNASVENSQLPTQTPKMPGREGGKEDGVLVVGFGGFIVPIRSKWVADDLPEEIST